MFEAANVNEDIDQIVEAIGHETVSEVTERIEKMFDKAASEILTKKNSVMKRKGGKSSAWFNKHCKLERTRYMRSKDEFRRQQIPENMANMKAASKNYKKALAKAKRDHDSEFLYKLKGLKGSDPKSFWKMLNLKKQRTEVKSDSFELYDHFKKLNQEDASAADEVNLNGHLQPNNNDILEAPFTPEEIVKVIKTLKNNKSVGIDGIMNEYIKATQALMVKVYTKLFNNILDTGELPSSWLTGLIVPIYKK